MQITHTRTRTRTCTQHTYRPFPAPIFFFFILKFMTLSTFDFYFLSFLPKERRGESGEFQIQTITSCCFNSDKVLLFGGLVYDI